jgi:hypothetical protein
MPTTSKGLWYPGPGDPVGRQTFQTMMESVDQATFGLRLVLRFTSSGQFSKANYPWLRALRARVQGGGGAGGRAEATGSSGVSAGAGGAAGGYAERLVAVDDLLDTEVVTVGAGGAGSASGLGEAGSGSSFGAHCTGNGGAASGTVTHTIAGFLDTRTASAGSSGDGDLVIPGGSGQFAVASRAGGNIGQGGSGGGSHLGGGGRGWQSGVSGNVGQPGTGFGSGGGGSANSVSQPARAGGNGAPGVVILELYS